ncbi:MAG: FAD-dependent oxidoreductase [Sphingobium sp.]|nr:FAD-dependent oxidoreductase [Sphingobium sp.]
MAKIDTGAVARAAEKIAAKDPFDVLVVGGGPAGAAAAIYAARKGIRTGVVASSCFIGLGGRHASRYLVTISVSPNRRAAPSRTAGTAQEWGFL